MLHVTVVLLTILAVQGAAVEAPIPALDLTGEAAEAFLREAEILGLEKYENEGITKPRKATLTDGTLTLHAVFKDVDTLDLKWETPDGRVFLHVTDSYKHEIAMYELDKLLGLDIVPPTVERQIGREVGSLQLWVDGSMREWERKNIRKVSPPDMEAWNNQISTLKVYLQLIWDTDFNNISNLLVDESWKLWKIDASRAFYIDRKLRREDSLNRFSRKLLAALENLDRDELEKTLKPWLSPRQIKTLGNAALAFSSLPMNGWPSSEKGPCSTTDLARINITHRTSTENDDSQRPAVGATKPCQMCGSTHPVGAPDKANRRIAVRAPA
jgi:hypothetical protein